MRAALLLFLWLPLACDDTRYSAATVLGAEDVGTFSGFGGGDVDEPDSTPQNQPDTTPTNPPDTSSPPDTAPRCDETAPGVWEGEGCGPDTCVCEGPSPCQEREPGVWGCGLCEPGLRLREDGVCVDVDECATGENDCDPNARCENTFGGYSCVCLPGFDGDGRSCEEVVADPLLVDDISAHSGHVCAVQLDKTVVCWGRNHLGQAAPPPGEFEKVVVSVDTSCGLTTGGEVVCWGDDRFGEIVPPEGVFLDLDLDDRSACALDEEGEVVCWGRLDGAVAPPGPFSAISAAGRCALPADGGGVVCWGAANERRHLAPDSTFVEVGRQCALRDDGAAICWSGVLPSEGPLRTHVLAEDAVALSKGVGRCALRASGELVCQGEGARLPEGERFVRLSLGTSVSCGVRADNSVRCWGDALYGQSSPPEGTYTRVATTYVHACAIQTSGALLCWGQDASWVTEPRGAFIQLTAGRFFTCGIRPNGQIRCWGDVERRVTPPAGSYTELSAGDFHTCALRRDGRIVCWGDNDEGQLNAPSGVFIDLNAGRYHTCAVRADGTGVCWGGVTSEDGAWGNPPGRFRQISAGGAFSCGVREDRTVTCWGNNDFGQLSVPGGDRFAAVYAGDRDACAIDLDGFVRCWGRSYYGQANPATHVGAFLQLEVGAGYNCGVREDRTLTCWGAVAR